MKKINSTKLMAVLAALCLVTSSFVGSTLAKYITTANSNDAARVAKFGVVLQADGNLFGVDYIDEIEMDKDDAALAVAAANDTDELVAPGTENAKGLNFSLNGTPEVATKLDAKIIAENIYLKAGTYAVMVKAPDVTADSFKADTYYTKTGDTYAIAASWADATEYYTMTDKAVVANDYYPVVFSADTAYANTDVDKDTINLIAAEYAQKLNGAAVAGSTSGAVTTYELSKEYAPNFDYSSLGVANDNLTWKWYYENGSEVDEYYKAVKVYTYDAADTILGDLMAGTLTNAEVIDVDTMKAPTAIDDYNLTTSFNIEFTVTQLDKEVGNN